MLSSASDEPDYGLDIGLWENNDTKFGKEYGYGKQPFGNPKLDYGTQAPFHMGFYHESGIIYDAARVSKKLSRNKESPVPFLAKLAFQTGHPYWGYRFAGWGLHYLQDLTMPSMPPLCLVEALDHAFHSHIGYDRHSWTNVTGCRGSVQGPFLIEKLLCQEFHDAFQKHDNRDSTVAALRDSSQDTTYPLYADHFPSQWR